jgi:glycosyltransferase involved in cell wall biosynthesis
MAEPAPRISVVVPTRERPQSLRRCLAALERQTVGVEVVVVEDAQGRGPAAARNEGAQRAAGKIVCFTDDDCAPEPGWAEALSAPILAGEFESSAGAMAMGPGATAADRAWEAIVAHLQEWAAAARTPSPGFAITANLACTRTLLERLPFDESFPLAAGEDRDWAERASRLGASPAFVPAAVVVHRSGLGIRNFLRQQYRYGRGAARYRDRGQGRRVGPAGFYLGLLRRGFVSGPGPGLLVAVAQAAALAGVVAERVGGRRPSARSGALR